jgi:hypothetical protein
LSEGISAWRISENSMSNITAAGQALITELARRYGLSEGAVEHMARAVANGGGSMAQFNVPELGGSGQWMAGGMTMVGDMFNVGLQSTVANLCGELANAMTTTLIFEPVLAARSMMGQMGSAWPDWLGPIAASGGQNQARYAYFPQACRLAFDYGDGRPLTLLDTGDHRIGGFSQQQSGPGDPFFGVSVSSQYGQFVLSSFPLADGGDPTAPAAVSAPPVALAPPAATETVVPEPPSAPAPALASPPATPSVAPSVGTSEILSTIEALARLRDAGALSEQEFSAKKTELLARL